MIYFDHAATSWPKPQKVSEAMVSCLDQAGGNPGRAGHALAISAGRVIWTTRQLVGELMGVREPARVLFTLNGTDALNIAILGSLRSGDHVVTTLLEHNSVLRPLYALAKLGVTVTHLKPTEEGSIDADAVSQALQPNTKLVVVTHASNVTGTIQPIERIGQMLREQGVCFLVDVAQTAGYLDLDFDNLPIDMMASSGHKGLLGPQGTGVLCIRGGLVLEPLRRGGTGGQSEQHDQPETLPDRYEAGTPNTPGIAGLGAGIRYLREKGLEQIRDHTARLFSQLLSGLREFPSVEFYGPRDPSRCVPIVSLNLKGIDAAELAHILNSSFGIAARAGLHCAPMVHQVLGTERRGALRLSLGYSNTVDDITCLLAALQAIIKELC